MDTGKATRLSVVIPTWNGKALLAECLESLRAQTFRDFEVVVVDDGSTDATDVFVKEGYPEAVLVRLPENRGFCRAMNAGLVEAHGNLLLALNNDMTLDAGFLAALVDAAVGSDAHVFAPLVLWRDDPATIYCAGDRQLTNGRPESIGFRCPLDGFIFEEHPFGASAGAALYRREVIEEVGLFDESFGAYFEDGDLNFRMRLAGYSVGFVRDAVAYHRGSASMEGRTWWRARQCFRNHALLVIKDMPLSLLVRHAPDIIAERLHQARRVISSARVEFGMARALAILAGAVASLIVRLPVAFMRRLCIQWNRRLSAAEVDALLTHPRAYESVERRQ